MKKFEKYLIWFLVVLTIGAIGTAIYFAIRERKNVSVNNTNKEKTTLFLDYQVCSISDSEKCYDAQEVYDNGTKEDTYKNSSNNLYLMNYKERLYLVNLNLSKEEEKDSETYTYIINDSNSYNKKYYIAYTGIVDTKQHIELLIDGTSKNFIGKAYAKVDCSFHSGGSSDDFICKDGKTIIVSNDNKQGIINILDGKEILPLEYNNIQEVSLGIFITEKDGMYNMYNSEGEKLLNEDYVYIGKIKNLDNFILIDKDTYKITDMNFNEKGITDIIKEDNFVLDSRRWWTVGYELMYDNIKTNDFFDYSGTAYTGKQYMLYNVCDYTQNALSKALYVLNPKDKSYKVITSDEITDKYENSCY